jgi:hypothetical protein
MVRGWSTEDRRSSVREGTREMRELRWVEVCLGSRRRRRSLWFESGCEIYALGLMGAYSALSNWSTSAIVIMVLESFEV